MNVHKISNRQVINVTIKYNTHKSVTTKFKPFWTHVKLNLNTI